MFLDYLQYDPGSGAMFSCYLQATPGKNEIENGLAFKGFKNLVNGIFGENGLDENKLLHQYVETYFSNMPLISLSYWSHMM